jgi:hypothetical protein
VEESPPEGVTDETDYFPLADHPGVVSRGSSNRDAKWVTTDGA